MSKKKSVYCQKKETDLPNLTKNLPNLTRVLTAIYTLYIMTVRYNGKAFKNPNQTGLPYNEIKQGFKLNRRHISKNTITVKEKRLPINRIKNSSA